MTDNDDLDTIAALCEHGADAALDQLIKLGPRPADPVAAGTWDAHDSLLKNRITTLNNLASSTSALIVSSALQDVWPKLDDLGQVTAAAQANIARIDDINKALMAIASIVDLGVAAVALATQPTAANVSQLVAAFKNVFRGNV